MLAKFTARRKALTTLIGLVKDAIQAGQTLWEWRQAMARTAQAGDLDALYEVYVTPTQARARRYLETGSAEKTDKLG